MDPFTEKLLERTRARRENLQKKMAERPNAANRPMVKRPRDPLTDTNNMITESVIDKVPQPTSKLSPYKRRCSGENVQPTACEESQEQMITESMAPVPLDPPTDKKPPMGPGRQSSLERTATRTDVKSQSGQQQAMQPELKKMVTSAHDQSSGKKEPVLASSDLHRNNEDLVGDQAPRVAGMKSRLQRLAEQRKYWDGESTADAVPDCTPLSQLKRQAEVPPDAISSVSSETPLGRKGRLANLAATIGSWEDDLSHVNIPKENIKQKPCTTVPKLVSTSTKPNPADSHLAACSKSTSNSNQQDVCSFKSSQVVARSPKKDDGHALQSVRSPQKTTLDKICPVSPQERSNQMAALPPSRQKASPSPTASVPKSPFTNQCRGLNLEDSPRKPELCAKPALVGKSATEEKTPAGGPSVKSFLERFGERCQERTNQAAPTGGTIQAKTPTVALSVTPNTKLVQERLRAAQAANTTTADLTQRQKMERESELAKIRSCFQNGNNIWKNDGITMKTTEPKKNADIKEQLVKPIHHEKVPDKPNDDSTATSTEITDTPTKGTPPAGHGLVASPPAQTSSPLRVVVQLAETPTEKARQKEEMTTEIEMNVDQSINSAVISELFDGVLEQSEDEDDEEDALNISSMSLLTPLAETVAAVVKSPEKKMMTSTPASSFIVKSPDNVFRPSKFQRTNLIRTASSESVETLDEEHKLPYSIDAYRSTRVKEPERPNVKQVIVRNEDVSHRAEEPRGSSHFSIKQKIKILTNEINLQQTVIHQASQALNCCTDEEHGKGSLVEAEAERLLLVAVERRQALKEELDHLKGGKPTERKAPAVPDSVSASASRGTITLQNLQLPLKADFVCSTANKPESTKHSFFIMIRAGAENTVATPLASTHCGLSGDTLTFPTKFALSDVSSDFVIDIEVYGLVQKREACSDKKKPSKSKAITPKRFLGISKSAQTPVVASPGGPNAIRTSSFGLVGSHKITLSSIGKNKFPLEKVPFLCPLEGHIYLRMQCEVGSKVEESGFLTMFEDVSGFGAWHRRWCVLSGYQISYWTYPDDEKRKNPIGRINLSNCSSNKVEPANREFCARPNTFELITVRPQRDDDKETLVSQCKNTLCVTKHWLSADTKDERNLWMKKLNQIVVDLRMWQPGTCYRPA